MPNEKPKIVDDSNNTPNDAMSMTLIGHLIELRERLMRAIFAILTIFLGLFYFANDIYTIVSKPIRDTLPEGTSMIATEVTSPFFAPFKLTLAVSFFLAIPVVLHQAWKFISPGLYAHEKKIAIPLLISSILLFYIGMAFAYFVIFPIVMAFFTSIGPADVQIMPDINQYLTIALKLFFAFGLAFEIPVATLLLIWSGVTTPEALKQKRAYVIVSCFVLGMLLTPPDFISQTLLAMPMWLLFEAGILFSRILPRRTH
jgi:sec-independent protein translocase protein TatC